MVRAHPRADVCEQEEPDTRAVGRVSQPRDELATLHLEPTIGVRPLHGVADHPLLAATLDGKPDRRTTSLRTRRSSPHEVDERRLVRPHE